MVNEFKEGDIVKIKPEWANSETEKEILFVIVKDSIDNIAKKCKIRPITGDSSKLPIVPVEKAAFEMLLPTNFNFKEFVNN